MPANKNNLQTTQYHRKVQVVVVLRNSGQSQVLLLQTTSKRGSFWQNVTGSVEESESYREAALRELQEETGLTPEYFHQLIDLNLSFQFKDQWERLVKEECFLALLSKNPETIILDQHEHQTYRWVDFLSLFPEDYKFPSNYEAFTKACSHVNNQF